MTFSSNLKVLFPFSRNFVNPSTLDVWHACLSCQVLTLTIHRRLCEMVVIDTTITWPSADFAIPRALQCQSAGLLSLLLSHVAACTWAWGKQSRNMHNFAVYSMHSAAYVNMCVHVRTLYAPKQDMELIVLLFFFLPVCTEMCSRLWHECKSIRNALSAGITSTRLNRDMAINTGWWGAKISV